MLQKQREALEAGGVFLNATNPEIHFGVGRAAQITFEPGAELRAGRFDISRIGAFSYMGGGATIMRNIERVGRFCSIAPNLVTGPVEHPTDFLSAHCLFQGRYHSDMPEIRAYLDRNKDIISASRREYDERYSDANTRIRIGNDVWIGEGVFIKRGVKIGDGAVVAGRSVVLKDVPPYTIVGGVPAKPIRKRFEDHICEDLAASEWWKYGLAALDGADLQNAEEAAVQILKNVRENNLPIWTPTEKTVRTDGTVE